MKRVTVPNNSLSDNRTEVLRDPRWAALRTASAGEIDAYLNANVQTLAQARTVLRSLLVAVRFLMNRQPT